MIARMLQSEYDQERIANDELLAREIQDRPPTANNRVERGARGAREREEGPYPAGAGGDEDRWFRAQAAFTAQQLHQIDEDEMLARRLMDEDQADYSHFRR
jgi:hypothetical protein